MPTQRLLTRRDFVHFIGGTAVGLVGCSPGGVPAETSMLSNATLRSRPGNTTENARTGLQPLGLARARDGFLYVPTSYSADRATPLVVLLHGATQDSSLWTSRPLASLFDNPAIIALIPDSRDYTWDLSTGGFGPDVRFIDDALALTFRRCNIDPARIALGGFSDGASYALSLGVGNGDLFSALIAFSPGYLGPAGKRGRPRIFVAHGTQDRILPIDRASRIIVPRLRNAGYDVHYEEFDGPHTMTDSEVTGGMRWFVPA